jgi:8-oxo-dGTP pyrophosphatase MutT (NUDIX family)
MSAVMSGNPVPQWRRRLLAAVTPLASGVRDLKVDGYRPTGSSDWRPNRTAAVLVPLLDHEDPQVVLTRRADHLPHHPGQISFPGGAAESGDESAVQTAMREAWEEIGLPAERTTPIGFLDRMDTISDYRVLPVVALVRGPVEWRPDLSEVAEVFTLPLAIALDRSRYETRTIIRGGEPFQAYYLQWRQYTIWGATAAMLLNLVSRIERVDAL